MRMAGEKAIIPFFGGAESLLLTLLKEVKTNAPLLWDSWCFSSVFRVWWIQAASLESQESEITRKPHVSV